MHRKTGRKTHQNNGFTLVELIVILVILAILAAILVPACLGFIDRAKRNEELTHAKALYTATQAKLASLYDQGLMPNVDHRDLPSFGSVGYSWKTEWGEDALFSASIGVDPYICGFFAGSMTEPGGGRFTYRGKGLSGLKKGYKIYVFVYLEKNTSKPWFYYNDEWTEEAPVFASEEGCKTIAYKGETIYLAEMCVFNHHAGDGSASHGAVPAHTEDASRTWQEIEACVAE